MAGAELDPLQVGLRQEYQEMEKQVQTAEADYQELLKAKMMQICRVLYGNAQKQRLLKNIEAVKQVTQRLLACEDEQPPPNVSVRTLHEDTLSLLHTQETALTSLQAAYALHQREEEAKIESALQRIRHREATMMEENERLKSEIAVRKQHLTLEQEKHKSLKATNLSLKAQLATEAVKAPLLKDEQSSSILETQKPKSNLQIPARQVNVSGHR